MDYKLREHATKILKLQAEILSELEGMFAEAEDGAGAKSIAKLQSDQVHWQNRFTRLVYLSSEVIANE